MRWRFFNGYGPDRYGNVYDRNGNLLYKTKGKVADMEVQQYFVVEKVEESTQYIPIENVISTLKKLKLEQLITRKKNQKKSTKELVEISEWQKLFRKVSLLLINIKRKKDQRIKYPKMIILN